MATRQTTVRFPERTDQQIQELAALFGDVTKTVVVAIDRLYQSERGEKTMSGYKLDIYTWPTGSGIDPEVETTYHDTPDGARAYVDARAKPFWRALLQWRSHSGFYPCGFDGRLVDAGQWPGINGENGQHPAVIRMRQDWQTMIDLAVARYHPGVAMVDIALAILQERHPMVNGWFTELAKAAIEKRQKK